MSRIPELLGHARDCLSRFDVENALRFLGKANKMEPDNCEVLDLLSETLMDNGNGDEAAKV
jgi:uncharacterized protein HemY